MILKKDETEIKKVMFEGDPTVWNIETKFEGEESKVIS